MPELQAPVYAWLEAFDRAWRTDDPADVRALWSEDAIYYPTPFSQPWIGADTITREWLALGESSIAWDWEWEVVTDDPDASVVTVRVTYPPDTTRPGFAEAAEFRNVWIVRFDAEGRAREYTEYWVAKP